MKILFADDQIPPDDIPDNKILIWAKENYPDAPDGFISAFLETRKTVDALKMSGRNITIARKLKETKKLIEQNDFDIVIIDLGWCADKSISESECRYKGWDISRIVEKKNRESLFSTREIIYSAKFLDDPEIGREAGRGGKLPVIKTNSEPGRQSLLASISFIETQIKSISGKEKLIQDYVRNIQNVLIKNLEEPLAQYKVWFFATLSMSILALLLLIIGIAFFVLRGFSNFGLLVSASSLLLNAITVILINQLNKSRNEVKQCREKIVQENTKAMQVLIREEMKG